MEENLTFIPLLLVIFLAFIVPLVLSRITWLRLPVVVGEILAGILIGRSGLGLVQEHDPVLDLLAEFGFVFLMFLSGMEIDFSSISLPGSRRGQSKASRWGPMSLGSLSFAITLGLSLLISFGLQRFGLVRNPLMMALILSTTSLGVVMPVLKEHGLSRGEYGQTLLISALIADFATMLLITIVVAVLSTGLTFEILLIGLLFIAFFLMYHFGMFFFNRISGVRRAIEELSQASSQIKVRAAFTIMLIFIVLSEILGTEIILGAFLAGAIISLLRRPEDADLQHKLEAIGFGFFIPIFFIMVGVDFNFSALANSTQAMLLVPLLLLAAFLVKMLPSLLFRLTFTRRQSIGAGALLSARLSLIIAASAIGLQLGVISDAVNAAIILVALITVTLAPLIFIRLVPAAGTAQDDPILVAGADDLGIQVARQLKAHGEKVVIVDSIPNRIERAMQLGLEAVVAQLDPPDPAAETYLNKVKALVCTYKDVELNYNICSLAHTQYGIDHLVAQVNEPSELGRFSQIGVYTINAALDHAAMLALLAHNPGAFQLLTRTEDDKTITEVIVQQGYCDGRMLRDIQLPGDVLALAMRREGELIIPHGSTRLECGDHLTLVGSIPAVEEARSLFSMESSG